MYIVISCSILAIILTYLESKGKIPGGMMYGFILMTTLCAIHYDYGNDYMPYYNMYKDIAATQFSWDIISNSIIHHDSGWVLINYLFKPLGGFFTLVIFLSVVQNTIIYKFIKREVALSNQTFAVFLYLMTTSLYMMSFSMLRQWFVVCVLLGCWRLIKERHWFKVLFILYLCTFIHGSAKLLLPLAFWGFLPVKNGKVIVSFVIGLFVILLTSKGAINNVFSVLEGTGEFDVYFERYGDSSSDISFGFGFILQLLPLIVACWYLGSNHGSDEDRSLVLISSIGFVIMVFASVIPIVGRVSTYFTIFKIAAIPLMYSALRNRAVKYLLTSILIMLTVYDYIMFFYNPIWIEKYFSFKTIFSAI